MQTNQINKQTNNDENGDDDHVDDEDNGDDDEHNDEDQNCHNSANFQARASRFCVVVDWECPERQD